MFSDHEVYHGMAMTTDEFNGHDASWTRGARPAGAFLCDAFFSVADSVYVGPENGMTPAQWETARVPLPPPGLPLHPPRAGSPPSPWRGARRRWPRMPRR